MLNFYLAKSYSDAMEGKKKGELVCWASSIVPCEFLEVMDVHVLYPENHAAAVAARHGALEMIGIAENQGYSIDNCSYARINLAYMSAQKSSAENMPLPDFLLVMNNICSTLVKWYENLAYELKIPIIMIDTPYNYDYESTEHAIDFVVAQFQDCIKQLEVICGKKFDYDRFKEVLDIAQESTQWWTKAMGYAAYKPSPLVGFDIFNYMALIVCMRGKTVCRDTFKKLAEELQAKVDNGEAAFPEGEKYRIMWDGIACWPYLNHNFKTLRTQGINMTGSTYPYGWALVYDKSDMRSMAKTYLRGGSNISAKAQLDGKVRIAKECNCEGITYHLNRSCKTMGFLFHETQTIIAEQTGTPYITFDGDQSDPRNFSKAQFETRVQGLAEMMEQRKAVMK
jgi:benzoyl-CoA reductase/2-hydroxyglutaryl-CoA dehydratase subunit BcrC/BadD/HgdB